MPGSYCNLLYHVVFSTKGRYPLITAAVRDDLHAYMGGIVREREGIALAIGGMPDHVHLLIKIKPKLALSDVIRDIKAVSSKWMNETKGGLHKFGWQDGFAAFTVSHRRSIPFGDTSKCKSSITVRFDFKAELLALFQRNRIQYDEATLWD